MIKRIKNYIIKQRTILPKINHNYDEIVIYKLSLEIRYQFCQQHFPFFFFLPPISSAFTSLRANLNVSRILDGYKKSQNS